MDFPRAPLQSLTSITYTDDAGATGTVAAANYVVDADSEPGRLALAAGGSWPGITLRAIAGVKLRFVAGYGDDPEDVPQGYKQAMLLLVGHWYENREAVISTGAIPKGLSLAVDALLMVDRNW